MPTRSSSTSSLPSTSPRSGGASTRKRRRPAAASSKPSPLPQRAGLAQSERVAARRRAEHPAVLPAELRWAVVADREADAGDIPRFGDEPCPRLVQADLLLELDRRHRGDR